MPKALTLTPHKAIELSHHGVKVSQSAPMEGQVIARHKWIGHPPFSKNQQRGSPDNPISDSLDEYGVGTVDPWISRIASWLETGTRGYGGSTASPAEVDYDMVGPGTSRYLTWHLTAADGAYEHVITSAKHENAGSTVQSFINGEPIQSEYLHGYNREKSGGEGIDTYKFGINDDGSRINSNTAPYIGTGFLSPSESASMALLGSTVFNPNGWPATVARSAYVTATSAYFHVVEVATDPGNPSNTDTFDCEFLLTLENAWPFDGATNSLQGQLDTMLAQVNLNNKGKKYAIKDDSTRKLDSDGEKIIVTMEGPSDGIPVHYVFTSVGEWNWDIAKPSCVLACNITDCVNYYVLDGAFALDVGMTNPPGLITDYNNGLGYYWEMIKSQVYLPKADDFKNTVYSYRTPSPDSSAWSNPSLALTWPVSPNDSRGGDIIPPPAETTIHGNGMKYFQRGQWITITKLEEI